MFPDLDQLPFSAKFSSRSLPPPKRHSQREREYLRPSEVEAMIGAARKVGRHGVRDSAIILLMFRHGLRTAELVALKWSHVDLVRGYIEIQRVKQGHDSLHPLRSPELRAIVNYNEITPIPNMSLFRSEKPLSRPELFVTLSPEQEN